MRQKYERNELMFVKGAKKLKTFIVVPFTKAVLAFGRGNDDIMAIMNGHFFSVALHRNVPVIIVIPTEDYGTYLRKVKIDIPNKVLILLSGIGEKYDIWTEKDDLEKRARETRTIIVLVEQYNSFAVDVGIGRDYFTYFHSELFAMLEQVLHSSLYVKKYYITGISLGGYNALKIGLCSNKVSEVFSFSGIINPYGHIKEEKYLLYNKGYLDSFFDTEKLSALPLQKEHRMVRYYLFCGTDAEYYEENANICRKMHRMGYEVKFIPMKGQKHNWKCWQAAYEIMWKQIERE